MPTAAAVVDAAGLERFALLGASQGGAVCIAFAARYRWQYIVSGVMEPRFQKVFFELLDESQATRIRNALAPLTYAVPDQPDMPMPMAA